MRGSNPSTVTTNGTVYKRKLKMVQKVFNLVNIFDAVSHLYYVSNSDIYDIRRSISNIVLEQKLANPEKNTDEGNGFMVFFSHLSYLYSHHIL